MLYSFQTRFMTTDFGAFGAATRVFGNHLRTGFSGFRICFIFFKFFVQRNSEKTCFFSTKFSSFISVPFSGDVVVTLKLAALYSPDQLSYTKS